ncbi:MAG: hypothetical protein ABJ263_04410 [Tateyamaria sp.]|uniref:hypothetical protein n=1 Tax=Tateyamaria sp. TaxID=1929288 RepID=UPI00328CC09B
MKPAILLTCAVSAIVLMGCATVGYTPPEDSSLIGERPYPNADDVCVAIGENELTQEYLDDSATLIGCPTQERGAISDRINAGGITLETIGGWVLLSVPD